MSILASGNMSTFLLFQSSAGLLRNLEKSEKVLYICFVKFGALKCLKNRGFVSGGLNKKVLFI